MGLNRKITEHFIEADDGPFMGYTARMVDSGEYAFKYLNTGEIIPQELFTNAYSKEVYESEHVYNATKQLRISLYAKYEKSDLHKVIETHCQHLTMTQRNYLLKLLQKFEELFDGTLVTWKKIQ